MIYNNSWIEINKKALIHNIKAFKKIIGDNVQLISVVKSNAYGHGLEEVSYICDTRKEIGKLATVNLEEALRLKKIGIKKPILVLSYYDLNQIKNANELKNIELVVYNYNQALKLNKLAEKVKIKIIIHLKIDTGTSRLGILPSETIFFTKKLKKLKNLETYGLFTHLATAEEKDQKFTLKQIRAFKNIIKKLSNEGINIPCQHTACSAAILVQKKSHFNAVRLGISLYGLWSLENHTDKVEREYPWFNLKPILSWKTKIIQIKTLKKNTTIGYGQTYKLKSTKTIAILPVGYWDGYDRKLSNKGQVLINNSKCKVLGRVCMNLTMVDITHLKKPKVGDPVVLIGTQGKNQITADEIASKTDTINYEVVTRLNPLIPRILK